MKTKHISLSLLALVGLGLAGCPADDAPVETDSATRGEESTTSGPTTTPMTMTTDPDTTAGTVNMTGSTSTDGDSSTTEPEPGPFVFDETPYDMYTPVDRKGFPAVNTGLILPDNKDAYNAATPVDDAMLTFRPDINISLETFHLGVPMMQTMDNTGLDDDLAAYGLEPCIPPPLPMNNCDDQAGPFAIPDVLTIDLDDPAGFPNGRALADPVMDIIFAVLLLDLDTHEVTTFLDLDGNGELGPSLNPLANDVEFGADFPYLAPAHE